LGSVDVNVHPAKTEVKFTSDKQVFDGVYYAALGALERSALNRQSTIDKGQPGSSDTAGTALTEGKEQTVGDHKFKSMRVEEYRKKYSSNSDNVSPIPTRPGHKLSYSSNTLSPNTPKNMPHTINDYTQLSAVSYQLSSNTFRVIGEALKVYIIVEYQDSVWFIDKHAVHERIHFDALRSGAFESMSESLLTPVICRLGHDDVTLLLENEAFLDDLGFTVESFGEDAVAVRHIPAEIDIGDTEYVLSEICAQLKHGGSAEPLIRDNIYKAIACKAAIKAGRSSGISELEALAEKVMSGEVSHCPHGRPVAFEISKTTLDKGFKRL